MSLKKAHRQHEFKNIQKGLDFGWEQSVTVLPRKAPKALPGSCPAGFRARAGLSAQFAVRHPRYAARNSPTNP
jgi:hypothetical protein